MRRLILVVSACALLGAWSAAPAVAHTSPQARTACAAITLELAGFPAGTNTVTTSIALNGIAVAPVVSTFQGPAVTLQVPLPPFRGTRTVTYQTSWNIGGVPGSTPVQTTTVTCWRPGTRPRCCPCQHRHRVHHRRHVAHKHS